MKKDFKTTGFKTPEDYFGDLEGQLTTRMDAEKLPKSTGFKVPKDYFSQVGDSIGSIGSTTKKQTKVIPLFLKKYSGYAAAIAVILIIAVGFFNTKHETSSLDSIQISLIDKYIDDGNLNMDLYDLMTYLESSEIPIIDFENPYFTDTDLENYLMENMDEELFFDH